MLILSSSTSLILSRLQAQYQYSGDLATSDIAGGKTTKITSRMLSQESLLHDLTEDAISSLPPPAGFTLALRPPQPPTQKEQEERQHQSESLQLTPKNKKEENDAKEIASILIEEKRLKDKIEITFTFVAKNGKVINKMKLELLSPKNQPGEAKRPEPGKNKSPKEYLEYLKKLQEVLRRKTGLTIIMQNQPAPEQRQQPSPEMQPSNAPTPFSMKLTPMSTSRR